MEADAEVDAGLPLDPPPHPAAASATAASRAATASFRVEPRASPFDLPGPWGACSVGGHVGVLSYPCFLAGDSDTASAGEQAWDV